MNFGQYKVDEPIEVGDVVCSMLNIEHHGMYPFSTCVVTRIDENVIYLTRPYSLRNGYGLDKEDYTVYLTSFREHYRYYVTGLSGRKYNIYK